MILGIDPGGTTGFAKYTGRGWKFDQLPYDQIKIFNYLTQAQVETPRDGHLTIVCESFEFSKEKVRDKIDYTPVEIIGLIKWYCNKQRWEPLWANTVGLHFQSRGFGKGHFSDDKIKALGLWTPGARHAMDACKHVLQWMSFNKENPNKSFFWVEKAVRNVR